MELFGEMGGGEDYQCSVWALAALNRTFLCSFGSGHG